MSKKIWMFAATGLLAVGLILGAVVMRMYDWSFQKMANAGYQTNTYPIIGEFRSISMNTDTADIVFVKSDDGSCKLVCYENGKTTHCVSVTDGVLNIGISDSRKWYEMLLNLGKPQITVYLPETSYDTLTIREHTGNIEIPGEFQFADADISVTTGDIQFSASVSGALKLKSTTGQLTLRDLTAGSVDLSVTTGKVQVNALDCEGNITLKVSTGDACFTDVSCASISSTGNTGSFTLENVIAKEKISIERSTGHVVFTQCDAGDLSVHTNTGDISGSFLTEKIVFAKANTGKVNVPQSTVGGRCEITTDTGDIQITISSQNIQDDEVSK